MKLTKQQRYIAYCIMLAEFEPDKWMFFCHVIRDCFGLYKGERDIKEHFPELWKKKPLDSSTAWWTSETLEYGMELRREALKQCIIETHPK